MILQEHWPRGTRGARGGVSRASVERGASTTERRDEARGSHEDDEGDAAGTEARPGPALVKLVSCSRNTSRWR